MKRVVKPASQPVETTSPTVVESADVEDSSRVLHFIRWASPALLGLIVPELWEDAFSWLRTSGYQPLAQFGCVVWVVFVVVDSLPVSAHRRRSLQYRVLSTLLVAVLCGAAWWLLIARNRSAPPTAAQQQPAPSQSPPVVTPSPTTAAPPTSEPLPPKQNPQPPPIRNAVPKTPAAISGAAKCEALGAFIERGRKLDAKCRTSDCANERDIADWTKEVRSFLKQHLTPREVIEFDSPPQQNWAVHDFPATGPKLRTLHELYGRWNMLREFLSRVDCSQQ
jgi:hypothetical protein